MSLIPVIGLEVHVELKTDSKMFCPCVSAYGGQANSRVCSVCLGHPGALPLPNQRAVELALRATLALNARVSLASNFDRKHYQYPDLVKGYQTTQYFHPLAQGGGLDYVLDNIVHSLEILRLHLEEDTGKSVHLEGMTLLDFNRAGIPLLEVVFAPDLHSPEAAGVALKALRDLLVWLGVSEGKMEEGSLRCDANISLAPADDLLSGTRVELKNLNSFRSLERALTYEIQRQGELLTAGVSVSRETRSWDEDEQVTVSMRDKEEAGDYRYLPDPDLPPLELKHGFVEAVARIIPELPLDALLRLQRDYHLEDYQAGLLTANPELLFWFEATVTAGASPEKAANWLLGEVTRYLKEKEQNLTQLPFTPGQLARLIQLVEGGCLSNTAAKEVLTEMFARGGDPQAIAEQNGLVQLSNPQVLADLVRQVVKEHPEVVRDYRGGKTRALGFLVGKVMQLSGGRANPALVRQGLLQQLEALQL